MPMLVCFASEKGGAGKTTLANCLFLRLKAEGVKAEVLDGDVVRTNLCAGLGFSREDRDTNVRRIGFVAGLLAGHGIVVLVAAISPYREVREELKRTVPGFLEVHCDCSLEVVQERDPKGLYRRVAAGEIQHFTGIDDPYEAPLSPDIRIDTAAESITASTDRLAGLIGLPVAIPYCI